MKEGVLWKSKCDLRLRDVFWLWFLLPQSWLRIGVKVPFISLSAASMSRSRFYINIHGYICCTDKRFSSPEWKTSQRHRQKEHQINTFKTSVTIIVSKYEKVLTKCFYTYTHPLPQKLEVPCMGKVHPFMLGLFSSAMAAGPKVFLYHFVLHLVATNRRPEQRSWSSPCKVWKHSWRIELALRCSCVE